MLELSIRAWMRIARPKKLARRVYEVGEKVINVLLLFLLFVLR